MNYFLSEAVEVASQNKAYTLLICSNGFLLLCLLFRNFVIRRLRKEQVSSERNHQDALLECKAEEEGKSDQRIKKDIAALELKHQQIFSNYKCRVVERDRLRIDAADELVQRSKIEFALIDVLRKRERGKTVATVEFRHQQVFSDYKNEVVERYRQRIEGADHSAQRIHSEFRILYLLRCLLGEKNLEALDLKHQADLFRYNGILEVERLNAEFVAEHERLKNKLSSVSERLLKLKSTYAEKKYIYNHLIRKISEYEEDLELMEYGVYKPHFSYMDLDDFKQAILAARERQKEMIHSGTACVCHTNWHVNNSYAQGRVMVNRERKLMLRAFNGECDAAIAKATWNNATTMEERIHRAFQMINKLSKSNNMEVTEDYLDLKREEYRLHYEKKLRIREEKEEQRSIRESLREEQKLQKDVERAAADAERLELLYQKALKQAERDLEGADYIRRSEVEAQVQALESQLEEALRKKERALSQAQQTRAGYVYIISNLGCFGDDVFKIGMTRRLEPIDRIRELSGASVPFPFDVHGMIYSEDAPSLEHALHQCFESKRVNMINSRKEFFRVSLSELQRVVSEMGFELQLTKLAEAQQYRETLAMLSSQENMREAHDQQLYEFPDSI